MDSDTYAVADRVLDVYRAHHDLNSAFIGVEQSVREEIENDPTFQYERQKIDNDQKEHLIMNLKNLAQKAKNESVKLHATLKLGELFFPEIFARTANGTKEKLIPKVVILKGNDTEAE